MNRNLPTTCRALVTLLAIALLPVASAVAQSSGYQGSGYQGTGYQGTGYQPPNFSGMSKSAGMSQSAAMTAQRIPVFPASPLAGGPAAAQGGEFMDVQGRPIVLPASYGAPMPNGAPMPYCDPMAGNDPMAVDFGGYGQDQCGPHYFDVSFNAVFLQGGDFFADLAPFTAAGLGSPDLYLDADSNFDDYEPGWEIAARYDVGALAVLEASYMGLYDIGFSDVVLSANVAPGNAPFSLVSIFNNYGVQAPINGIDQGSRHAIDYQADLQSTEFNYRRYWVGNNTRVSGTWLLGARYLRYTDEFNFNSTGLVLATPQTAALQWRGENDMVGFHFGGDAWVSLRQGLRLGIEGTTGVYNNRYKFSNSGTFSATTPADYANAAEGNQVAFATEADVSMVADILPSWSLRGGYRVLFLNSLATAANNINQSALGTGLVSTQDGLLFHGFHGGLEYVW